MVKNLRFKPTPHLYGDPDDEHDPVVILTRSLAADNQTLIKYIHTYIHTYVLGYRNWRRCLRDPMLQRRLVTDGQTDGPGHHDDSIYRASIGLASRGKTANNNIKTAVYTER